MPYVMYTVVYCVQYDCLHSCILYTIYRYFTCLVLNVSKLTFPKQRHYRKIIIFVLEFVQNCICRSKFFFLVVFK